ncbi:hypothetical protein [Antrihabitans spumae]|uniref:Uncharacterized protein n=1 Tax=Antrihabitans spumae TaxID=3373370 RepID=A0ABW7K4Y6_9NOCA
MYDQTIDGGQFRENLTGARVTQDVGWQDAPITDDEAAQAMEWLHTNGFLSGTPTWGGTLLRPQCTPKGVKYVETERSVNDWDEPAHPQGTNITISNSTVGNFASNSPGATQKSNLAVQTQAARQLADNLDSAAVSPGVSADAAARAREAADDLRAEADLPEPSTERLRDKFWRVLTDVAGALGQSAGTAIASEASAALQNVFV